jgi:hypothetical protein
VVELKIFITDRGNGWHFLAPSFCAALVFVGLFFHSGC